ncbi:MAG TPA: hypothetical protein VK419_12495, partial [Bryobacteraceae bacterium]|nr:hypothetical protein [Bryobacteraceae bacterium]
SWGRTLTVESGAADVIRRATYAGQPLGSREFVEALKRSAKISAGARTGERPKKITEIRRAAAR